MSEIIECIQYVFSDAVLFILLQIALVVFAIFAAIKNIPKKINGRPGANLSVARGEKSMAHFYGAYATITATLVALCLQVEFAKSHRVFFVLLNVSVVAYLCFYNAWFRNHLLHRIGRVAKLEE